MNRVTRFARNYLVADTPPVSIAERWRSALAGLIGILFLEVLLEVLPVSPEMRKLLAPAGASAVILYSLPHSPLGQPWSVAGGLGLSALAGLLCGQWIAIPWLAIACAVAISIWLMASLRCLHPPGGAMAIVMASLPHAGLTPLASVGANILGLVLGAMFVNNILKGRFYPQCSAAQTKHAAPAPLPRGGIEHQDLSHALNRIDSYLDISESDLVNVYNLATAHAFSRHSTTTCGDLMTRDVIAIEFATELSEVWQLLRGNHIKALPVLDRAKRVIGLLTLDNFLDHVPSHSGKGLPVAERIQHFIQATPGTHSSKPEVAGQIMSERYVVVHADDDISSVASLLSSRHHPHAIPVVDANERLVGILSQTDILAALYHQLAIGQARALPEVATE